jgi:hypothetical protein
MLFELMYYRGYVVRPRHKLEVMAVRLVSLKTRDIFPEG